MQPFFHKRFDEEFLLSDRLRTKILAGMFLFGTLYTGILNLYFADNMPSILKDGASWQVFLFLFLLFLFELSSLWYINRHIKGNQQRLPLAGQYLSAAIEITAPSIVMVLLPVTYHAEGKILQSPIVYIYFLFIILSTLRLNFYISLSMGLLAALEFFLVSRLFAGNGTGASVQQTEVFSIIGKATLLLFSGIGAAFVARQIKLSVDRSLKVAEQGNRVVNLFGQQVSKEVVKEMIEKGGDLHTKLARVCVMFVDIRNFTRYVADKTPAEIVDYQNAFFRIVVKAVLKHGGIINQFLGDGCMATFGAPVSLDNPSQHAFNAALEIKAQLAHEALLGHIAPTTIGIGIHEGDAVTGNIGPAERQQYSITGSVVILASRIEQLNKEYNSEILVSETVMQKIRTNNVAPTKFIGNIVLKGWGNAIGIYQVA